MTDHETIVISALRYALGRRSYIMSVTEEYIDKLLKERPTQQFLAVAAEDIEDHIRDQGGRKDPLMHEWHPLLERIKSQLTEES